MKKILIVDDSETVRHEVRSILERNSFEVVEAEDGELGLLQLKAHSDVCAIITDFNMPNMNGMEFVKRVFSNSVTAQIPTMMLTTEFSRELKIEGKKNGIKVWMVKPCKAELLTKAVQTILNETVEQRVA
jgi:two-component system, chemotaxis family, chemotaxis protein CheY